MFTSQFNYDWEEMSCSVPLESEQARSQTAASRMNLYQLRYIYPGMSKVDKYVREDLMKKCCE